MFQKLQGYFQKSWDIVGTAAPHLPKYLDPPPLLHQHVMCPKLLLEKLRKSFTFRKAKLPWSSCKIMKISLLSLFNHSRDLFKPSKSTFKELFSKISFWRVLLVLFLISAILCSLVLRKSKSFQNNNNNKEFQVKIRLPI